MKELEIIQEMVCDLTGLDITKNTRQRDYVTARAIYFRLCKELVNCSNSKLSRFSGKNRATIVHWLKDENMEYAMGIWGQEYYEVKYSYVPPSNDLSAYRKARRIIENLRLENRKLHKRVKDIKNQGDLVTMLYEVEDKERVREMLKAILKLQDSKKEYTLA